ncbi:TPA: hypothetical protein JFW75_003464 [Salmonella enterica]|nr:hypothetical protein [Salmonella enterica]
MNDITALAATLKRAAQEELMCREASDTSDLWQDEAGPENILVLVEALEAEQQKSAKQGRHACDLFDEVVAQRQRIAELERANAAQDDHINQQQDRIEQLEKGHQEAAKQINSWRRLANIAEHENVHYADAAEVEITALRQRIAEMEEENNRQVLEVMRLSSLVAELESRTVTVKLYDDFQLCHYGTTEGYAKGYIDGQNNFIKWLVAAGIKVKGD